MKRAVALACLLSAGCVAIPHATYELESARAAYQSAAASSVVQARAPVELQIAERALADAERLHNASADPKHVAHFAYLAEQRARIALTTAELRNAEAALLTSGDRRGLPQLDLSTRPSGASGGSSR